jgi:hypothetical protein
MYGNQSDMPHDAWQKARPYWKAQRHKEKTQLYLTKIYSRIYSAIQYVTLKYPIYLA